MSKTSAAQARPQSAGKSGKRRPGKAGSTPRWLPVAGVILALALVAGAIFLLAKPSGTVGAETGTVMPIQGQEHILVGASHPPYNSDPPTSGWHYDTPVPSGFYDKPVVDEYLVHNLEHGHVVISYDCARLPDCEATKTQIRDLITAYRSWKVDAVPRTNKDAAIALTAWGRVLKLEGFEKARIEGFINTWRDQGPEKTTD